MTATNSESGTFDLLHTSLTGAAGLFVGYAVKEAPALGPWAMLSPEVIVGRSLVAFTAGAAAGGLSAYLEGEENLGRIVSAGVETGLSAALGAAAATALVACYVKALRAIPGIEAAIATRSMDPLVPLGEITGRYLAAVFAGLGTSVGVDAFTEPAAVMLPTQTIGAKEIPGTVFGRPGDKPGDPGSPSLFEKKTLPIFPPEMQTIECPYMKGHTPDGKPYPPEYYISAQTENIHAVTVPDFLTQCFHSFGDDSQPAPNPGPLNALPEDSVPTGAGLLRQQYDQLKKNLARTMAAWNKTSDKFLELLEQYHLENMQNDGKGYVNSICHSISQQAPTAPSALAPGYEDNRVLAYLQESIAAGEKSLKTATEEARNRARRVNRLQYTDIGSNTTYPRMRAATAGQSGT